MQLLLVDEHPLVRDALESLLRATFPSANVTVVESHEDAFEAVRRQSVDLIVANLISRHAAMLQNLPELVSSAAPGKVVVFGEPSLGPGVRQAIAAGVHGYVPATSRPELIAAAIGLVAAGGVYFPQMPSFDERPHGSAGRDVVARLSLRQRDVFHALKEGKSNKVIARELMISVATVKQHVQAILKLSGASNRTEAAALMSRQAAPSGLPTESGD
ncbi:MAG TPA: response regulator transcription factor [Phenylobacterium sp.]|jgi:two-component system nitrate/nitrite response regulator NarL|uniref:response regulator transcription factor n=1 Tax=Phenylobacterium sp. TaxID=1871053 RepID=UPI002BD5BAB9|nr:response regulator transcription factor [Phenylobacterium sp.]HXA40542.1 response regulator transcription factor [Phenylobacterium sp.]